MIAVKLARKVLSVTESRCAQSWSLESRKVLQKQIPIALLSNRNRQCHLPNLTPSPRTASCASKTTAARGSGKCSFCFLTSTVEEVLSVQFSSVQSLGRVGLFVTP